MEIRGRILSRGGVLWGEYHGDRYGNDWDKWYDVMTIVWTSFRENTGDGHEVVGICTEIW